MKHLLITAIYFSSSFLSYSQCSYQFTIETTNEEFVRDISPLPNGSSIICFDSMESYFGITGATISKINNQGFLMNKIQYTDPSKSYSVYNLIRKSDTIFCVGEIIEAGKASVWMLIVDTNLNVISDKRYQTTSEDFIYIRSFIDTDNNLNSAITMNLYGGNLLFIKFSPSGDSLLTRVRTVNGYSAVFDFFQHNDYYRFLGRYTFGHSMESILLDSDFNTIQSFPIPLSINNSISGRIKNADSYYIAGKAEEQGYWNVTLDELDFNSQLLNYTALGSGDSVMDFPATDNCLDFIDPNRLFVGQISPIGLDTYYSDHYNHFYITLFDSTLQQTWNRGFGGDKYYCLKNVYATEDGGVILTATVYDYMNPDNLLDLLVMKLNSEGLLVSADDINPDLTRATAFPNPGNDYFYIKTPDCRGCVLKIVSITGNILKTDRILSSDHHVNTSDLSKGIYFWQVIQNDQLLHSGKWIKN